MRDKLSISYEITLPIGGRERRIRTSLVPRLDDDGNVMGIVGSSTDLSSAQIVDELSSNAEAIYMEFENFINLAAHDLKTPIRQVSQIAELLRTDFVDHGDGKLKLIDLLERIGTSATSLISDVLSNAKATGVTNETVEFSLSDLISEIVSLLDPSEQCKIEYPNAVIEGDRTATQIILRNLIDNAIKSSFQRRTEENEKSKLHLVISISEEDEVFEIEVRDNGIGFTDTAIIFLNGGDLRTGSGYGLLGVRRLISARGGTLTAANLSDGSGAIVAFSLPGKIVLPEDS